jgi:hypothetical protein
MIVILAGETDWLCTVDAAGARSCIPEMTNSTPCGWNACGAFSGAQGIMALSDNHRDCPVLENRSRETAAYRSRTATVRDQYKMN